MKLESLDYNYFAQLCLLLNHAMDYNYFAQLCLVLNHAMKHKSPCKYWLDMIVADYIFPHRLNQNNDKKSILFYHLSLCLASDLFKCPLMPRPQQVKRREIKQSRLYTTEFFPPILTFPTEQSSYSFWRQSS